MSCPDSVAFDWATVSLTDNSAGSTTTILPKTCQTVAWSVTTSSIVAGHNYTLTLTSHDDNYPSDPSYTVFDDVTLQ